MKRLIAVFLMLAVVFGLCACSTNGTADETQGAVAGLQVGYARESIMPKDSIGMPGFANADARRSTGYKDVLYTSCIAFTEGEQTVLIYSVDIISIDATFGNKLREMVSEKTGVPQDRIMISATHNHTGPAYYENPYFNDIFAPAFVKSAEKAIADLAPTTMYGVKTLAEGISFVRHYITNNGEYVDSSTAAKNPYALEKHARETDPEMIVIKFDRGTEKKAISLINWQCHPCFTVEKDTILSADFIASVRADVEAETGMECIYFSGASGDLGSSTFMPTEKAIPLATEFGSILADKAIEALNGTMTKIEGSGVKTIQDKFEYKTNRFGIEKLEDAKKVKEYAEQMGSHENPQVMEYANSLGFDSSRQAATIVANADKPEMTAMELNALYIGGLAFVAAPYEMYAESGMFIKKNSPFEFTLVNTLSNAYFHYFPVQAAFDAGNHIYEVGTADFEAGVAEATADRFVELLKSLQ